MPSVKQIWKTKGMVDDPSEEGRSYSPSTAITVALHNTETLPDDLEIIKEAVEAARTEVAKLREELAKDLAPGLVKAIGKALTDDLADETLIAAAEQGVRRVLGGLDANDTQPADPPRPTGGVMPRANR